MWEHIEAARRHDILLIAPATAGILGKLANGLADDFLSTLYLAFTGEVVLAPSMNDNMWRHAATQQNLRTLESRGAKVVLPRRRVSCLRLSWTRTIGRTRRNCGCAQPGQSRSGGTDSPDHCRTNAGNRLTPCVFLSNRSSGKMGYALAAEAKARGASVILISGPVALEAPAGVHRIFIRTAAEMREAVFAHLQAATIVIMCAAVADFTPAHTEDHKIKKSAASPALQLTPTPDILTELGQNRGNRLLIGFAAETEKSACRSRTKIAREELRHDRRQRCQSSRYRL